MLIKNKFLGRIVVKLLGKESEVRRVEMHFVDELFDPNLTELAFYNQALMKFEQASDKFKLALEKAIANAKTVL